MRLLQTDMTGPYRDLRYMPLLLLLLGAISGSSFAAAKGYPVSIDALLAEAAAERSDCANGAQNSKRDQTTDMPYYPVDLNRERFDYSCLIDAQTVQKQFQLEGALLIDVRNAGEYQQYHIPGSINLPLSAVKYKRNFKNSKIVLINKGLSQRFLLDSCTQLKSSGFKQVSVLEGGLTSWLEKRYPLNRGDITLNRISEITPYEYFNSATDNDWIFISLDQSAEIVRPLLPNARVIRLNGDFSRLKQQLSELEKDHAGPRSMKFLVVDEYGKTYQSKKDYFSQHAIEGLFYLSEGAAGLQQYMQKHLALLERRKKGFQVRMGCGR